MILKVKQFIIRLLEVIYQKQLLRHSLLKSH
jgi:hypothetical protein